MDNRHNRGCPAMLYGVLSGGWGLLMIGMRRSAGGCGAGLGGSDPGAQSCA